MTETLFDIGNKYQQLSTARDHAAYRAVGALDAAICYCRTGDAKIALSILLNARADYERADKNLKDVHTPPAAKEAA